MELTARALRRFAGGQIEVRDILGTDLTRGQIASIQVQGSGRTAVITVKYAWKVEWVKTQNNPCKLNMRTYTPSDMGDGVVIFKSRTGSEQVVLYPKGASKLLKRFQVKGL